MTKNPEKFLNKNYVCIIVRSRLMNRWGFTLAETLITIGIIGIIAAMTIPIISHKIRTTLLKNQFKQASAILEKSLNATFAEVGDIDLIKNPNNIKSFIPNEVRNEINAYFKETLNVQDTLELAQFTTGKTGFGTMVNRQKIYKRNGEIYGGYYIYNGGGAAWILKNGITISPMKFQVHNVNDGVKIWLDTNGPLNGPNRLGYDIFIYDSGFWNGYSCSGSYFYGCYRYAKKDISPDNSKRKYWDSLK
ncbi:hypothetical protein IJ541_00625 [bacterium]|nr:hypothetical protein [bacterium]